MNMSAAGSMRMTLGHLEPLTATAVEDIHVDRTGAGRDLDDSRGSGMHPRRRGSVDFDSTNIMPFGHCNHPMRSFKNVPTARAVPMTLEDHQLRAVPIMMMAVMCANVYVSRGRDCDGNHPPIAVKHMSTARPMMVPASDDNVAPAVVVVGASRRTHMPLLNLYHGYMAGRFVVGIVKRESAVGAAHSHKGEARGQYECVYTYEHFCFSDCPSGFASYCYHFDKLQERTLVPSFGSVRPTCD